MHTYTCPLCPSWLLSVALCLQEMIHTHLVMATYLWVCTHLMLPDHCQNCLYYTAAIRLGPLDNVRDGQSSQQPWQQRVILIILVYYILMSSSLTCHAAQARLVCPICNKTPVMYHTRDVTAHPLLLGPIAMGIGASFPGSIWFGFGIASPSLFTLLSFLLAKFCAPPTSTIHCHLGQQRITSCAPASYCQCQIG